MSGLLTEFLPEILPNNGAVGGDTVYCVITPFDGSEYGTSVTSNTITMQNTAKHVNIPSIQRPIYLTTYALVCQQSY